MIIVTNLKTGQELGFSSSIKRSEAVISAYAHGKGDHNSWTFSKYQSLVKRGKSVITCGDWTTLKLSEATRLGQR